MPFLYSALLIWTSCNTVTIKSDTRDIATKIDTLDKNINGLHLGLTAKLDTLMRLASTAEDERQRAAVGRLRDCIKSAASVISAASTTLGNSGLDQSEHEDFFSEPSWQPNQHSHAWMGAKQRSPSEENSTSLPQISKYTTEPKLGRPASEQKTQGHRRDSAAFNSDRVRITRAAVQLSDTPYASAQGEQTLFSRSEISGHQANVILLNAEADGPSRRSPISSISKKRVLNRDPLAEATNDSSLFGAPASTNQSAEDVAATAETPLGVQNGSCSTFELALASATVQKLPYNSSLREDFEAARIAHPERSLAVPAEDVQMPICAVARETPVGHPTESGSRAALYTTIGGPLGCHHRRRRGQ